MARKLHIPELGFDVIEITDEQGALAQVAPAMGAWGLNYSVPTPKGKVNVLHCDYKEMALYPTKIRGGSPLLFPFPSWVMSQGQKDAYEVGNHLFHLPQHGFLRKLAFQVTQESDHSVTLEAGASEETLAHYPFEFLAQITFSLEKSAFHTKAVIKNLSRVTMPMAFGFHPYLSVPLQAGSVRNDLVVEMPYCTEISAKTDDWTQYQAQPFDGGEVGIHSDFSGTRYFTQFAYPFMRLLDKKSGLATKVQWRFDSARQYVALWAPDEKSPYFCIEPWSNLPNSFGRPDELPQIEPGTSLSFELILSVEGL